MPRPQFSLKAMLLIVAVLAVPLGMMVSADHLLFLFGCYALCIGIGGSVGYLLGGWERACVGMGIGMLLALALWILYGLLVWLLFKFG